MGGNMLGFDLALSQFKNLFREEATLLREEAKTLYETDFHDNTSVIVAKTVLAESLERMASKL